MVSGSCVPLGTWAPVVVRRRRTDAAVDGDVAGRRVGPDLGGVLVRSGAADLVEAVVEVAVLGVHVEPGGGAGGDPDGDVAARRLGRDRAAHDLTELDRAV